MIPDSFNGLNVTDTSAVWHLVGAETLYRTARRLRVAFVITTTVSYECFVKTRGKVLTANRQALRARLQGCLNDGGITRMGVSIQDLQDTLELAKLRGVAKRLGQGELSCAALARHLGHPAVLTDNKRDFKAIAELVDGRLQTTPRLLGWLYVEGHLTDSDIDEVVREHEFNRGNMASVYREAHRMACEKRLMQQRARA